MTETIDLPEGLCPVGIQAAQAVIAECQRRGWPIPSMYAPADWHEKGHNAKGTFLIVLYEGTEAARLFDLDACAPGGGPASAYEPMEAMAKRLGALGLYSECSWQSAPIYSVREGLAGWQPPAPLEPELFTDADGEALFALEERARDDQRLLTELRSRRDNHAAWQRNHGGVE